MRPDPRPHATDYGWTQHDHRANWHVITVAATLAAILLLVWRCAA